MKLSCVCEREFDSRLETITHAVAHHHDLVLEIHNRGYSTKLRCQILEHAKDPAAPAEAAAA